MLHKIKIVISDFHLSLGKFLANGRRNPLEDFHQDAKFTELLSYYSTGTYEDYDVELIINGDFFDPLALIPVSKELSPKTVQDPDFPAEVHELGAIRQLDLIMQGHKECINAIRQFLGRGHTVVFRWGNHDATLLWPGVQSRIREVLAPPVPSKLQFQVDPYVFDGICIDHGHQHEAINHFDRDHLFRAATLRGRTTRLLNLPFGSFFVSGFLNRIKLRRSYINQVQPFAVYLRLALIFDPVFFFLNGFRVSWFFVKMRFITHPMRFSRLKKTAQILMELFHRPSLEDVAERMLTGPGHESLGYDTIIMGHNHQAALRVFPNGKQYINTGTWTSVTSLDIANLGRQTLRTYALIEYGGPKPLVTLRVWNGTTQVSDYFS
jgi:UDP-2,3-diacylglucosamine pyrophosphatase LpxH